MSKIIAKSSTDVATSALLNEIMLDMNYSYGYGGRSFVVNLNMIIDLCQHRQKYQRNIKDNVVPHTYKKFHANKWSKSKVISDSCFLSFQKKLPIVVESDWRHCR